MLQLEKAKSEVFVSRVDVKKENGSVKSMDNLIISADFNTLTSFYFGEF